ncbi:MAG: hypothetical protein FWG45_07010 [Oscillospiraceae bacterium]|nr:hypothetical protein [Oscillospiraceae bacterium]
MSPYVAITTMNVGGREFILAEVARGMSKLGTYRHTTTSGTSTDVFFIEDEPIINLFNPYIVSDSTEKIVHQIGAPEKTAAPAMARFAAAIDNYYVYEQGLARSVQPVLELLCPGLYVVHESEVHPSDGDGRFFWTAYAAPRELLGTAEKNSIIGHANYTPGFLLPTRHSADFRMPKMLHYEEALQKGRQLAGISYHVAGMFSALLEGHHAATAALNNDAPFKCLMIEPLNGILYNDTDGIEGLGKATGKVPTKREHDNEHIIALTCPFVNIPLEELPDESLERFLIARKSVKPSTFSIIRPKMGKFTHTISKRAFPVAIYDKVRQLPNHTMVAEAASIDYLSEEQLEALSQGEVKYADEYIISSNLHTSISAACGYLQVVDFRRFMEFSIGILKNEKLALVHKFVAERLYDIIHPEVYAFFKACIKESMLKAVRAGRPMDEMDEVRTDVIFAVAMKYMKNWEEHMDKRKIAENSYDKQRNRQNQNKQKIKTGQGIATLEAAAKGFGLKQTV